jgi:hypothetical protein
VQTPQGKQRNFQRGNNYQAPPQVVQANPEPKKNDLEDALLEFFTKQQQTNSQTSKAIQRLETQVGQLAKELSERKEVNFQWKLIVNKSSTILKEKEKSFKVSWWLILMDITWRIGVLPIMRKVSPH